MRGGPLASGEPRLVHGMVGQPRGAPPHDVGEQPAAETAGKRVGDGLVHEVVRRRGPQVGRERRRRSVATTMDEKVAVAHAGLELPAGKVGEFGGEAPLAGREQVRRLLG